jgi:hypothetical protein
MRVREVQMNRQPGLQIQSPGPAEPVTAVVLVLPGGRANSHAPARRRHLAYQRMRFFATAVHRGSRARGVAVWQLRYRLRGWNGRHRDPVRDATWALGKIAERHPGVPVVLIGHSMGGRTSLHVSADPAVRAVCVLAPWIESIDPIDHLAGKLLVVAHGDRDQMTDPGASRRYARRAAGIGALVAQFEVIGDAHAMLKRPADWHALALQTVLVVLDRVPGSAADGQLAAALAGPAERRLSVPLAHVTHDQPRLAAPSVMHPAAPSVMLASSVIPAPSVMPAPARTLGAGAADGV